MRRIILGGLLLIAVFALPCSILADDTIAKGDELFAQGGIENLLKSGDIYAQALAANPTSYEAAWKAARSYREYCNESKQKGIAGWQDICKKFGKIGMQYGEKAIALNAKSVEGHFWFGCSVGNYSDGVSILTALKEGLKDKTQNSFEQAYALDKMYKNGGPVKALGRFWYVLPWPLNNKDKSMALLREYQQLFPNDAEGQVFLGELLIDTKNKDEAKILLQKAAASDKQYYSDWAKRLLAKL